MKTAHLALAASALLALAAPAVAQIANPALDAHHAKQGLAVILDTGLTRQAGAGFVVTQAWGYVNDDQTLTFCGAGRFQHRNSNFVVNMDGVNDDIAAIDVPVEAMVRSGCAYEGYRLIVGGTPDLMVLSRNEPPPPRPASTFVRLTIPAAEREDPDCVEGIELARRVAGGDMSVLDNAPSGSFNDLTRLRNLCFNAAGQALMSGQLNSTIARGSARIALANAGIVLNRAVRGY